jgi:hypothetical protein
MYYNYGQSLRSTGQLAAAMDAAIARRDVWRRNAQRLIGVAAELAQIARDRLAGAANLRDDETHRLNDEIIGTLQAAREIGWPDQFQLATDERFALLRKNPKFERLTEEADRRATTAEPPPADGEHFSSSTTN